MKRDVIVVGTSAGGVEALQALVSGLPADLPAAVLIVLHVSPMSASALPAILRRCGTLPAEFAQHDEPLHSGRIYIARPDYHLVVEGARLKLTRGPREHAARPAVDPLFRSAAVACGPQTIGVILSGSLDDGTAGLMAIKAHGGVAVVQDPEEAQFAGMPSSAVAYVPVDYVLPVREISAALVRLTSEEADPLRAGELLAMSGNSEVGAEMVSRDIAEQERGARHSEPSVFTCPDCGGVMWQMNSGGLTAFRCHVGHAFSLQSLLVEQAGRLEALLWSTVRALQEKASLARQTLSTYGDRLDSDLRTRFEGQQRLSTEQMVALRGLAEHPYFSETSEYEAVDKLAAEQSGRPPILSPDDPHSLRREHRAE